MKREYKVIYNPSIARQLLHKGNKIDDIKPNKENKFQTNFIFEITDKFNKDLENILNK